MYGALPAVRASGKARCRPVPMLPCIIMRLPSDDDDAGWLDEEFPLGDGTADIEATVRCPYCAQDVQIALDPGGGPEQQYVEDCQVCCQPWDVRVTYRDDGGADVTVTASE